ATLSIPVIASLNAVRPGQWLRYASAMAEAGADALELNSYCLATHPDRSAADVEAGYLDVIAQVRDAVTLPLAVKLSPYLSSLPHFAAAAVAAGADALVLFNRFYQPDLDIAALTVQPQIDLSDARDLRLPLRWLGILRPQLPGTGLCASSGVAGADELVKTLLVGADVAGMTSALLRHGPEHARTVLAGLRDWLQEHEYESVRQLRGSMSSVSAADAAAFERSHYVSVLRSYDPVLQW
ncbi:MAG TPA: hypothetical protein VFO77_13820, partial [Actinoplanes sp.]|nr:hypothetical protein [Actinoplanes sp.]